MLGVGCLGGGGGGGVLVTACILERSRSDVACIEVKHWWPVAGEILKRRLAITLPAQALTSESTPINRASLLSTPHSLLLVSTFLSPSFTVRLWGATTSWRCIRATSSNEADYTDKIISPSFLFSKSDYMLLVVSSQITWALRKHVSVPLLTFLRSV